MKSAYLYLLFKFFKIIFHSNRHWVSFNEAARKMHIGYHVKWPLKLCDVNWDWIVLSNPNQTLQYQYEIYLISSFKKICSALLVFHACTDIDIYSDFNRCESECNTQDCKACSSNGFTMHFLLFCILHRPTE